VENPSQPPVANAARAELVLHLPERIDFRAMAWLGRRIPDGAGFARVVLDFSAVRECQSFALVALMAVARQIGPRRIHTRGLNAHQLRVVQYCDGTSGQPSSAEGTVRSQ
jgi:hypothetical protein